MRALTPHVAEGRAPTGHSDGTWQEKKGNGGTNKFQDRVQDSYLLEGEFRPAWLEVKGLI